LQNASEKNNAIILGPSEVILAEGETAAQAAYRALRVDIIRGERHPGEKLRIEKLKAIYNIGPSPLREALQMLVADDLVRTEGNRGFTVAELDFQEFEDLNIARTAIELAALRLSIKHGSSEWEAGIVAAGYLLEKQDAALLETDANVSVSWESANARFHLALVAASGSNWLLRVRSGLEDQCARYRRASVYQKIGQRNLKAEHIAIREATLARDSDLACALIERHFSITSQGLLKQSLVG
jgi:GntR family carbon starvation induced transcriptional regulator